MTPDAMRSRHWPWTELIAFVVAFFLLLGRIGPLTPAPMSGTLDDSWAQASAYALIKGLRFGEEFVFTSGPFSPILTQVYSGPWLPLIAVLAIAATAFVAFGLAHYAAQAARSGGAAAGAIAVAALVVMAQSLIFQDALLMAVPLLTAVLYADRRAGPVLVLIGIFLSAAVGLAKFSVLLLVFGCTIAIDLLSLTRRELPYKTLALAVATQLLWMLAGQDWLGLPSFIVASLQVTAGYGEAMSLSGPWYDLALWVGACAATLALLAYGEFRAVRAGETDRWSAATRLALCLGFFAVLLKAGFVRHDLHDVVGWSGLGIAAFIFHRPLAGGLSGAVLSPMRLIGMAAGVLALGAASLAYGVGVAANPVPLVQTSAAQFREALAFATDANGWMGARAAEAEAAEATAAANFPVPRLAGTVDILDSRQSSVIASGLDYRPRPTIQEYTTYSPALIARNRAFFEGERAPDWMLFGFLPIDGRHPASTEGALWPLFLERYTVTDATGDRLVLKRRAQPLPEVLGPPSVHDVAFGATEPLPTTEMPLFVKMDIRKTLPGRLLSAIFRPPLVFLVLGYADGTEERFRLIPGQISEGMVLSPRVAVASDYFAIEQGRTAGMRRPSSFRLESEAFGGIAYDPAVSVSIQEIRMPAGAAP